jgi:hypothetical protein
LYFDEKILGWGSEDRDLAVQAHHNGLRVELLRTVNAYHFVPNCYNRIPSPEHILAFLKSKLYLRTKYPNGELAVSINLIRNYRLDENQNIWYRADEKGERSANNVLDELEAWLQRERLREGRRL